MPNTYTELRRTVVGTATPSVTFDLTGISGYTDLVVVISARGNNAGSADQVKLQVNADTGNNYSRTILYGTGSAAASARTSNTNSILIDYVAGDTAAAGTFGLATINLMNYSNSTTYKTILSRAGTAGDLVEANVGLWRNTAAITSIIVSPGIGTNWLTGSTFSLYGIANADQGAAKATGGIITEDSQYWYHTFGASGAFIPKQSLTCDILQIAGGGGGGADMSGGGGAGGLLYFASQSLTAISHNVTVGAGGSGSTGGGTLGTNGVNSQFAALTASVGGGRSGNYITVNGASGGSGGGAGRNAGGSSGGAPTTGQGFAGGGGSRISSDGETGGGGGAGAAGQTGGTGFSGDGGVGLSTYSSWGLATGTGQNVSGTVYYAGGGGGGWQDNSTVTGSGGLGGGGNGAAAGVVSTAGLANTGGGGGGGAGGGSAGQAGGSGLVIVRYAK
jgi:hypothetical protein